MYIQQANDRLVIRRRLSAGPCEGAVGIKIPPVADDVNSCHREMPNGRASEDNSSQPSSRVGDGDIIRRVKPGLIITVNSLPTLYDLEESVIGDDISIRKRLAQHQLKSGIVIALQDLAERSALEGRNEER